MRKVARILTKEHAEVVAILYSMLYRAPPDVRPYMTWFFEHRFGIHVELYPPLDESPEMLPFESKPSKKTYARHKIPR